MLTTNNNKTTANKRNHPMSHIVLSDNERHYIGELFIPKIEVIAYSLANINRFTGHVGHYSVAQHSVILSQQVPEEFALDALLHDATECYIGDVSAPLKAFLPDYQKLEDHYHGVIDGHFNIKTRHPVIKSADMKMLITEAYSFGMPLQHFPQGIKPYEFAIMPNSTPEESYMDFMNRFIELTQ